jgi:ABC transport system ATP-binding/permease protein
MLPTSDSASHRLAALVARGARQPPVYQGEPDAWVSCDERRVTLGRAPDCDIVLADPAVADRHAVLEYSYGDYYLSDQQSELGTYVNGRPVRRARLRELDLVQLGPYLFRFWGKQLQWVRPPASLTLTAVDIGQTVGPARLLDHVSLACRPGEFIGLLGPSGSGKSTLLNALSGLRPARTGEVYINGETLYGNYARYRQWIGYVPQDDIVHVELTSRQALWYVGRLRLPHLPADQLGQRVEETLDVLELREQARLPIGQLSGGQRKRINFGVELLTQPGILFLDEPTAGLDPGAEGRLMRKFQELAHQGRIVVCATHIMESVELFDKVAVLVEGGRLAWFGAPADALAWFDIRRFSDLYERLDDRPAIDWQRRFLQSPHQQEMRQALADERTIRPFLCQTRPAGPRPESLVGQTAVLAARFVRTLAADPQTTRLLFWQPLLIAALICLVFKGIPAVSFLLVLSAMWFGCGLAAQQIVKERAIYRRERLVNLRSDAYLLSKFLPLALVGAFQSAAMLAVVWLWKRPAWDIPAALAALTLAAANGVALGLLVSALSTNRDKASAAVPTVLLPQIILAGVLVSLPDMPRGVRVAADLVAARWANQALEISLLDGQPIDPEILEPEGQVWSLWNLYPEFDLRRPEEQQRFLAEHRDQRVARRGLLRIDLAALATLTVAQLMAVGIILRRKGAHY